LEIAEEKLRDAMLPFLSIIFSKFHDLKAVWTNAVLIVGELDCLMNLAIVSSQTNLTMCRPKILSQDDPVFDIKGMIHPCVKLDNEK
jgi:DNA mismatch repair protein MSH6